MSAPTEALAIALIADADIASVAAHPRQLPDRFQAEERYADPA